MNYFKYLFCILFLLSSFQSFAEEQATDNRSFISDDLFIYFHSGPGTEYRILGSINAGESVTLLGPVEKGYQQISDSKQRKGWVDANYVSKNPGLRDVVSELNEQLANQTVEIAQLQTKLQSSKKEFAALNSNFEEIKKVNNQLSTQNEELATIADDKAMDIKITYFSYGVGVLVLGLILGLVLPRIPVKRKSYSSWG